MNAKLMRKSIDYELFLLEKKLKEGPITEETKYAMVQTRTKLQEAKMWAGQILKSYGNELPEKYRDECKERSDLEE